MNAEAAVPGPSRGHSPRAIRLTALDLKRLRWLIRIGRAVPGGDRHHLAVLEEKLDRAELVASGESDGRSVTVNSRVRIRSTETGCERVVTLVFPSEMAEKPDFVSILTPLGISLLGARVGEVVEWTSAAGPQRSLILEVRPRHD